MLSESYFPLGIYMTANTLYAVYLAAQLDPVLGKKNIHSRNVIFKNCHSPCCGAPEVPITHRTEKLWDLQVATKAIFFSFENILFIRFSRAKSSIVFAASGSANGPYLVLFTVTLYYSA